MAVDQWAPVSPDSAAARLVEMSVDVRTAVVADPAGGLIAASDDLDPQQARAFAGLAADLFSAADGALGDPAQHVEAHVEGGGVFAARSAVTRWPAWPRASHCPR
ncbi:MAG: hypothetical protein WKF40_06835 [Thermoleophilaceae bacterium]